MSGKFSTLQGDSAFKEGAVMKKILFLIPLLCLILAGCGATEVGNPTSIILTGKIDGTTVDFDINKAILSDLTVEGIDEDQNTYSDVVSEEGYFSVEVPVGHIYVFSVYQDSTSLGDFSFEEDSMGRRGNRLFVFDPDSDEIDMGTCTYRDGQFFPENEPRRHMRGR